MMFCHFDSLGLHYKISATDRGTNRMVISQCMMQCVTVLCIVVADSMIMFCDAGAAKDSDQELALSDGLGYVACRSFTQCTFYIAQTSL